MTEIPSGTGWPNPQRVETGGSGGITEITATDDSVTVTNPTGPIVGLSASGGSQPVVRLLGLVDDFAVDALATKWPNATRAVVANGILDLTNAFSANAGSDTGYDMTGGQVKMKMVEGSQYAWLEVQNNDSGDFLTVGYLEDSPGVFKVILRSTADGVLTVDLATVDEVIPQWFRITEADGTLTVDVSYDGQEWLFATTRSTAAVFTGGFGGLTSIYFEIEGPGGNVVTKLDQFVFLKAT